MVASLLVVAIESPAFSLLGPFKQDATQFPNNGNFQAAPFGGRPQGLGYNLPGDSGGPMLPSEAYRWNVPVVTYAFDNTFLEYFGTNGVAAVEEAFAILNALPPASRMSADLSEYPLDTKSENGTASALGLVDLKSFTLAAMMEQMGLANPERFVWGLSGRDEGNNFTNYTVAQFNYDPVTIRPSRYVNGVLYNYRIFDDLGPKAENGQVLLNGINSIRCISRTVLWRVAWEALIISWDQNRMMCFRWEVFLEEDCRLGSFTQD